MTKDKAFVIGDIHGVYHTLKVMLEHWQPDEEQLILLGDYIDRGPQSYEVIQLLRDLQNVEDIKLLRGNHEQLLIDFLKSPQEKWRVYQHNGGVETMAQFLKLTTEEVAAMPAEQIAQEVQEKEPWLLDWLESLLYYTTFGKHIIVHAGVDFSKKDWRHTSLKDFLWIREPFHYGVNNTGRNIIFGHTPVMTMHDSYEPWVQDNKWGIDGGNVYGGNLIALRIDREQVIEPVIIR